MQEILSLTEIFSTMDNKGTASSELSCSCFDRWQSIWIRGESWNSNIFKFCYSVLHADMSLRQWLLNHTTKQERWCQGTLLTRSQGTRENLNVLLSLRYVCTCVFVAGDAHTRSPTWHTLFLQKFWSSGDFTQVNKTYQFCIFNQVNLLACG